MIKHFLSLASFSRTELTSLLDRAQYFSSLQKQPDKTSHFLQHKIVVNAFFEPSTRTRCSFEVAAKRMGGEVVNFVPENSSVKKGETIYDTLKSLESLGIDSIILRHSDDHVFDELIHKINIPLINAGAGKHEHPSQGLLDLLTIRQEFGQLEGLKIVVCGDIKHSRVAGSLKVAAEKFNFQVIECGPENLLPKVKQPNVVSLPFEEALPLADAVMMLRIQLERHESLDLNKESYNHLFGMNKQRLKLLKKNAIILHPGPFNRGVEIDDELVEHPQSRIFKQMSNGVFARMAILEWAIGSNK